VAYGFSTAMLAGMVCDGLVTASVKRALCGRWPEGSRREHADDVLSRKDHASSRPGSSFLPNLTEAPRGVRLLEQADGWRFDGAAVAVRSDPSLA
jgi:hypothetical protein